MRKWQHFQGNQLKRKEGERERQRETVSKGRYRVEGFSGCNVFATKELFACVLDVEEAYACLEASEKDTVIFPLYYQVSHKYEGRISKYKRDSWILTITSKPTSSLAFLLFPSPPPNSPLPPSISCVQPYQFKAYSYHLSCFWETTLQFDFKAGLWVSDSSHP